MHSNAESLVVIGGGVIGLSTAYYALKEGLQVTVLERHARDAGNCSSANAGMIVPSHFTPLACPGALSKGLRWMLNSESPFYIRPRLSLQLARWGWLFCRHARQSHVDSVSQLLCELNLESRRLFQELAQEGDFGLQSRGLLMLCQSQQALDEEAHVASAAGPLGLKTEVLDARAAAQLDPDIEMSIIGAVHFADDCHLDPASFLNLLHQRVQDMGGQILHGQSIDEIHCHAGKVRSVSGPNGRFDADHFVVAGGAWSPSLMQKLRLRLPMQAGKGYSLTLPQPAQLPQLCSILSEAKVAVTPVGNELRFAGTMEIGGNELTVNPARIRGIVKAATRYFPQFNASDFDHLQPWVGLRPVSPDGLPYLGRAPRLDNLVIATGHAMMGLSLAPVSGRLVADLLTRRPSSMSLDALSPARFA